MKRHTLARWALAAAVLVAFEGGTSAQTNSAQLTAVLAKMDAASKSFRNAQADFRWDYYEKIVHDTTTQTGSIYFEREGAATNMGAVYSEQGSKVQKVLEYKAGELKMFEPPPGVNQVTVLHAGANKAEYEGFLTLGFGGSGSDMAKAWNITDLGPETMDGVVTEKLDLVGKDPAVQKNFSHVTVWIDPTRAVSLKQVFYTPSGNYRTATYTHIVVNGSINKGKFAMKTDKKTQTIHR